MVFNLVAYPDKISNLISDLQEWERLYKNRAYAILTQIEAGKGLQEH